MGAITKEEIQFLNEFILDRKLSGKKMQEAFNRIKNGEITKKQYLLELFLSPTFLKLSIKNAPEFHLYFSHYARLKLVASLLPEAKKIIDLGGANGSIYEMGYPYKFDKITVVDLPPDDRDEMYKKLKLKPKKTPNGEIEVHFGDMSDLSFAKDNSVDLVWSGESIEHITEEAGERTMQEVYRVLKPGGYFCLDTPNRFLTKIHTSWRGGDYIHPEHKIEYYPEQLQTKLKQAGFTIVESRGVCEMPNTARTKEFDYTDFILGNALPQEVDTAYMQYYKCQKRIAEQSTPRWRKLARMAKAKASAVDFRRKV